MPPRKKVEQAEPAPKAAKTVAEKREAAAAKKKKDQDTKLLSRAQTAENVRAYVNDKYKGVVIKPTRELDLVYLTKRVPTGVVSLDVELGGGFPCAGITQLIGRRNCGKTWLYLRAMAMLQAILGDRLSAMFAMNEMHVDVSQARRAGLILAYSETMIEEFDRAQFKQDGTHLPKERIDDMRRQVGTFHEVVAYSGEDLYQAVLDGVYHNAYHIIAIDSVGNVMSEQEASNESLHDKTRGGSSVVNTQFIHKISPMLMSDAPDGTVRDPCVIVVNQIRDDQKNPDAPYKQTGGHALEHAKFLDIYLSPGQTIHEDTMQRDPVKGGQRQRREIYGKEVNWEIKKGKAGIHEGGRGSWLYYFNDDRSPVWARDNVDIYTDAALFAARHQLVEQAGAWYTLHNPEDPKNPLLKACGMDAFVQELYDDEQARLAVGDHNTLMRRIRAMAYKARDIKLTYEWKR
jgi:RecA/RadA recombinase